MFEVIFLLILAGIFISVASVRDLKIREIPNWLSFSLIIFALGFRFFYSLFEASNFSFFYQGIIGFGIFFILGNLFYYARLFAGGDAKLMIAMGSILPFSESFFINVKIFSVWFLIFLFVGMIYGLSWSFFLMFNNKREFKKEIKKQFSENKKIFFMAVILGLILIILGFFYELFFILGIFIFITPYIFIYAKAVDESCMIKKLNPRELTEGDWLYKDVKISKNKIIKATWGGLSMKEIKLLRKNKKYVFVRQGIPFIPVFFFSFVILIYFWFFRGIGF